MPMRALFPVPHPFRSPSADTGGASPAFLPVGHDHAQCRRDALNKAEEQCRQHGARLTDIRRKVLDILWDDHRPISAYDILHRLNAQSAIDSPHSKPAAPPVVYRALDFLITHGLAHKLTSLNAFIGSAHPGRQHGAQFFICRSCHTVAEVRSARIGQEISAAAAMLGFEVQAPVVEVEGLCPACRPVHGAPCAEHDSACACGQAEP